MSFAIFLLLCFALLITGDKDPNVAVRQLRCLNGTMTFGQEPVDLKPALNLLQNYRLVVRYSDLINNVTAKVIESNFTDALVIQKEQLGVEEAFYFKNDLIHLKNRECSRVDPKTAHSIYNISDYLRNVINNTATNLGQIFSGLQNITYNHTHVDLNAVWVDGVKAIAWYGCINQTEALPGVQVEVKFTGKQSEFKSYSNYENPLVASVTITVYKADNITAPKNITYTEDLSFNVVELEHTNPEHKMHATKPPRGVFCSNMTNSKLPSSLPDRFEAEIEYVDTEKKITDNVDLMYDGINHVVSFALDFDKDSDIPYIQNRDGQKLAGKARVYQDFNSGFEYILNRNGRVCSNVAPIQSTWDNVKILDKKLLLRDPTNVFFNITQEPVYYAGQVSEEGVTFDSYVSHKIVNATTKDYIVVELLFTTSDWSTKNEKDKQSIHSIVQYHKNAKHDIIKQSVIRFNQIQNNTITGTSWSSHSVYPCMAETSVDNFFFLKLSDVTMKTVQSYGYENVENALTEALSKTANISVLRISNFLFKTVENELLACFMLSEKSNSTPAQTKYLMSEKTIEEVRIQLNDTLKTQKLVVSVITDDLKTVQLSVTQLGLVSTKECMEPPYYGYSGGSMFITGIFMFMFGALGAVVSYVIYTKRQQVRGIAYQVFE